MTTLTKTVTRVTGAHRHEKSKTRLLVVSLEQPATVGFRLQGTRQTFRLGIEACYELAVMQHEREIERLAKKIARDESLTMRRARSKARIQMKEKLK